MDGVISRLSEPDEHGIQLHQIGDKPAVRIVRREGDLALASVADYAANERLPADLVKAMLESARRNLGESGFRLVAGILFANGAWMAGYVAGWRREEAVLRRRMAT